MKSKEIFFNNIPSHLIINDKSIFSPNADLSNYFKLISNIPLLSQAEEKILAGKVLKGDNISRNKMINANLRLVVYCAKKYNYDIVPLFDLIEEGNVGLISAVDRFNPSKNTRFSTYAVYWIKKHILSTLSKYNVNASFDTLDLNKKINEIIKEYKRKTGKKATVYDLYLLLNKKVPIYKIKKALRAFSFLSIDDDNFYNSDLVKFIADENSFNQENFVSLLDNKDIINKSINVLNEREKNILELHFGFNNKEKLSLKEIGNIYNVSKERIRQIEKEAIFKLKKEIKREIKNANKNL